MQSVSRRKVLLLGTAIGTGMAGRLLGGEPRGRSVKSARIMTEGDEIYYEVRGDAEPLLMIPGGIGDAWVYSSVAEILSDEYKVITYDRRGNSRSSRRDPQNFEVSQQARDAVAVLRAEGHSSALVFGSSGGGIIALEMAKSHPHVIEALVAHEPPAFRVLPDADQRLTRFADLYHTTWAEGYAVAWEQFNSGSSDPSADPVEGRRLYEAPHQPPDFVDRVNYNIEFFLKSEMIPFSTYKPDVDVIKTNRVKVTMAAGQSSLGRGSRNTQVSPILAKLLGCELVAFPGGHTAYVDMPEEWASVLRKILKRA